MQVFCIDHVKFTESSLKTDSKTPLNLSSYSCESKYKAVPYSNLKYSLSSPKMTTFHGMFSFRGFTVGDTTSVPRLKKHP